MGSIVDAKFAALRAQGFTGSVSDMTLQWLQNGGATANNLADAWREVLIAYGYGTEGYQRNDAWRSFLADRGYTGSISDMELLFWLDGGTLSGELVDNPNFEEGTDGYTVDPPDGTIEPVTGGAEVTNGASGEAALVQAITKAQLGKIYRIVAKRVGGDAVETLLSFSKGGLRQRDVFKNDLGELYLDIVATGQTEEIYLGLTSLTPGETAIFEFLSMQEFLPAPGIGESPEIIIDGAFDDGAPWVAGSGWTIGSGVATAVTANTALYQDDLPLRKNHTYYVTFDWTRTAGEFDVTLQGQNLGTVDSGASGTFSAEITVTKNGLYHLDITGTGFSGTIDNVSVKEIIPVGGEVAWNPANLVQETLALWLDADDADTLTDTAGEVETWTSKDPDSKNFAKFVTGPDTGAQTINGRNVLRFDGTHRLQSDLAATQWGWLHGFEEHQIYLVGRMGVTADPDSKMAIMATASTGTAEFGMGVIWADDSANSRNEKLIHIVSKGVSPFVVENNTANGYCPANTPVMFSMEANAGNPTNASRSIIRLNGSNPISNNTAAGDSSISDPDDSLIIGSNGTNTTPFIGDIAEIIVVRYPANDDVRQQIEGYLAHKWGLTGDLSEDHPYKFEAPTVNEEPEAYWVDGAVINRDFSTGDFTGWTQSDAYGAIEAYPSIGGYTHRFRCATASQNAEAYQDIAIPAGAAFVELSAFLALNVADSDYSGAEIKFLDASDQLMLGGTSTQNSHQLSGALEMWGRHIVRCSVPTGAAKVRLLVSSGIGQTGTSVNGMVLDAFVRFLMTNNAIVSTSPTITNPGFETGDTTGWTVDNGPIQMLSAYADPLDPTGTSWSIRPNSVALGQIHQDLAVPTGRYTHAELSVWLSRSSADTDCSQAQIQFLDGSLSVIDSKFCHQFSARDGAQRFSIFAEIPGDAIYFRIVGIMRRRSGTACNSGMDNFQLKLFRDAGHVLRDYIIAGEAYWTYWNT